MERRSSQRRGKVSERVRAQRAGTPGWVWLVVLALPVVGIGGWWAGRAEAPPAAPPDQAPVPQVQPPDPPPQQPAVERPAGLQPPVAQDRPAREEAIAKRADNLLRAKLRGSSVDQKLVDAFREWADKSARREAWAIETMTTWGVRAGLEPPQINAVVASAMDDRSLVDVLQAPALEIDEQFLRVFYERHMERERLLSR